MGFPGSKSGASVPERASSVPTPAQEMKAGYLSEFFGGVGWKRLSRVEVDPGSSNQHEFNGSKVFTSILGNQERRIKTGSGIPAKVLYFREGDDVAVEERVALSWYDTRRKGFYPNAKQKNRKP